jgi:opacity protein-like surface antigen
LATLLPAVAAAQAEPWALTGYLQRSYPRQTRTNQQIEQINDAFGADFDTWDDAANLNLGTQVFRRVSPRFEVGAELDWSRGAIDGAATIPTGAGPARLAFEQRYSTYADLLAVAHYLFRPGWERARPFALGGAGVGYEKDRTTLTLRNDFVDESLRVDNDGWFPIYTVGLGLQVPVFGRRRWYVEGGVAYVWARLEHRVPAEGSLAPAPEVIADTDSTGPNFWVGIGRRFAGRHGGARQP